MPDSRYPLPAVMIFEVDGGQIWMNLGAQPEIEIEYRTHNHRPATVLTEKQVADLAARLVQVRRLADDIEAGKPVLLEQPVRLEDVPF